MNYSDRRRRGMLPILRSGALVKAARESKHVSNKDLCTALDMRPSQLSDIERGIASLALRRAWQISRHLGADFAPVVAAILQERLHEAGFTELRIAVTSSDVEKPAREE